MTCGASLVVTAAVIGATAVAGNVVGQAITKGGFDKVNVEDALLEGTIAVTVHVLSTIHTIDKFSCEGATWANN